MSSFTEKQSDFSKLGRRLPIELVLNIISLSARNELVSFSQTCRAFQLTAEPLLYRSIELELDDFVYAMQCLHSIASVPRRARCITRFAIGEFKNAYNFTMALHALRVSVAHMASLRDFAISTDLVSEEQQNLIFEALHPAAPLSNLKLAQIPEAHLARLLEQRPTIQSLDLGKWPSHPSFNLSDCALPVLDTLKARLSVASQVMVGRHVRDLTVHLADPKEVPELPKMSMVENLRLDGYLCRPPHEKSVFPRLEQILECFSGAAPKVKSLEMKIDIRPRARNEIWDCLQAWDLPFANLIHLDMLSDEVPAISSKDEISVLTEARLVEQWRRKSPNLRVVTFPWGSQHEYQDDKWTSRRS